MHNELQHFGVKGMKWGVRKYRNKDGTLTDAGRKQQEKKQRQHEQLIKKRNPKKLYQHRKELSDDELEKVVNRLGNEKKLKDLSKKEITYGQKAAIDVLKYSAKIAITVGVVYVGGKYAKKKISNSDTYKNAVELMKKMNKEKETAVNAVKRAAEVTKDTVDSAKKTTDAIKKNARKTRLNISRTKGARTYVNTFNKIMGTHY